VRGEGSVLSIYRRRQHKRSYLVELVLPCSVVAEPSNIRAHS